VDECDENLQEWVRRLSEYCRDGAENYAVLAVVDFLTFILTFGVAAHTGKYAHSPFKPVHAKLVL